jgi:hypothetical protein
MLRGNGTRAGYLLRYGNIVPESERVMVDARTLQRNQDYTIDYTTGTLSSSLIRCAPHKRYGCITATCPAPVNSVDCCRLRR